MNKQVLKDVLAASVNLEISVGKPTRSDLLFAHEMVEEAQLPRNMRCDLLNHIKCVKFLMAREKDAEKSGLMVHFSYYKSAAT